MEKIEAIQNYPIIPHSVSKWRCQQSFLLNTADFMEEMRNYECLYNKFSRDYKNNFFRLNCWKKIGEKFKMTF